MENKHIIFFKEKREKKGSWDGSIQPVYAYKFLVLVGLKTLYNDWKETTTWLKTIEEKEKNLIFKVLKPPNLSTSWGDWGVGVEHSLHSERLISTTPLN